MKICTKCKLQKSLTDFYKCNTHSQGVMCYCKNCFNKLTTLRWINRKKKAQLYKGNKCQDCNILCQDNNYVIFEFHHLDPIIKDYDWSKLRLRNWNSIIKELDKCILLCANCHRLRHFIIDYALSN